MVRSVLIAALLFTFTACDDDDATGCTADSCAAWEVCGADGACTPDTGRCNSALDCAGLDETCNVDTHSCEALAECIDSEDCLDAELPVCDNGTCVAETLTCNEDGLSSEVTLAEDSCVESTDCIDSSDCADGYRCENLPVDGETFSRACCVEGLRGCLARGEACEDEFDCESGLCMDRNGGTKYCTGQCSDNTECPDPIGECYDMVVMQVCVEPEA